MSGDEGEVEPPSRAERVSLGTIAKEWLRLGCIGFGGPPTHIALLRRMCVEERQWIEAKEFEDAIATTNLLPGPASTQLAIYCAWRLRGAVGAVLGGLCFIVPGLVLILALSAVFLAEPPARLGPRCRRRCWGCGAGGGPAGRLAAGPGQLEPHRHRARSAAPLGRLRHVGRGRRGYRRPLPGAGPRRLRADGDRDPPSGSTGIVRRPVPGVHPCGRPPRGWPSAVSGHWPGWRSRSAPSPMAAGSSSSRSCSTTPSPPITG